MASPQHSSNDAAFMKFWQRYLRDHGRYGTRVLHFVGNCFAVVALVLGVVMLDPVIPIVGVLIGYVFAWMDMSWLSTTGQAWRRILYGPSSATCGCFGCG